jgi:hypothetical protein
MLILTLKIAKASSVKSTKNVVARVHRKVLAIDARVIKRMVATKSPFTMSYLLEQARRKYVAELDNACDSSF